MSNTSPVLEFKSSTFFVPVLLLYSNDLHIIEQHLKVKISQAPEFFGNSPLVFDVQELNKRGYDLDVVTFTDFLRDVGLLPIGIRGGNEQQNEQARKLFITVDSFRGSSKSGVFAEVEKPAIDTPPVPKSVINSTPNSPAAIPASDSEATILITHPIRSGQSVYATGDLVIMSQVSAGAEVMAEGNIHIYNTLRGRALAGVQGNKYARIFCFDLQAELVSIAGDYKTSETLDKNIRKKPVQIYLQNRALIIKELQKT